MKPFFRDVLVCLLVLLIGGAAYAVQDHYSPNTNGELTRTCGYYGTGGSQSTLTGSSQQASFTGTGVIGNVRVICTTDTYFAQGTNPTAGTTGPWFVANLPEWVALRGNDKLAFRAVSAAGNCVIQECK